MHHVTTPLAPQRFEFSILMILDSDWSEGPYLEVVSSVSAFFSQRREFSMEGIVLINLKCTN